MKREQTILTLMLAAAVALWVGGCNRSANHSETPKGGESGEHDHEHHHHGPHNGHMMEIGEEEYHAEWTHDESGKVTFYILDSEAKKDVPVSADEIVIDVKIGDKEPATFKLAAVDPMDGKSSTFETINKQLLGVLEALSPGVKATLHVNINGKQFDTPIKEHEHGH